MTALRRIALTENPPELCKPKPASNHPPATVFQPPSAAQMRSWFDQIGDDALLSAKAHRVARKLGHEIIRGRGIGDVSGKQLAARLRCSLRTAQEAVDELVAQNHLTKEIRRGRGRFNHYRIVVKR